MPGHGGLDFERRDVFTRAADDVLAPVDEVNAAVARAAHRVAGVKPAIAPGMFCRGSIFQIAAEKMLAWIRAGLPYQQLSRLALGNLVPALVGEAHFQSLRQRANAARADMTRLAARRNQRARPGFGHRPGLDQRKTETRFERRVVFRIGVGAIAEAHAVGAVTL